VAWSGAEKAARKEIQRGADAIAQTKPYATRVLRLTVGDRETLPDQEGHIQNMDD
jgi:hypothetical protein